jgi:hypothetical protein
MPYPDTYQITHVNLNEIDFNDRYFKISRNHVGDELRASIKEFGVLDPPVVISVGGRLRVVFGFNRLDILRECGADSANVLLIPDINAESYCARALLKCQRNESGPLGRLSVLAILAELGMGPDRAGRIARKGLRIPDEFAFDRGFKTLVDALPAVLKDFLDSRDVQFRIIRDLVRLPATAVQAVSSWLAAGYMRVNIFKFLIDMLSDILTRDGDLGFVDGLRFDDQMDKREWEEYLYDSVYKVRYPEYSSLKSRADEIGRYFAGRGILVEYPPYFEGDQLDLTMSLRKGDDPEAVRDRINETDLSKLKKLLELL